MDLETVASAQQHAVDRARALRHTRLMARLNSEVLAIDGIRSERERKARNRKRTITFATIGGSALFTIGILIGALNTGRISVSVSSDAAPVQQLAAPPAMMEKPKAIAAADQPSDSDAERLSVIIGRLDEQKPSPSGEAIRSASVVQPLPSPRLPQSPFPALSVNNQPAVVRVPLPAPSTSPAPRLVQSTKVQVPPPPLPPVIPKEEVPEKESSAVEVDLRTSRASAAPEVPRLPVQVGAPISPSATAAGQGFRIIQYMDTYVLIRVGNKVSTVKVGERLPDGRLLKAVADGSITTEQM